MKGMLELGGLMLLRHLTPFVLFVAPKSTQVQETVMAGTRTSATESVCAVSIEHS